MSLTHQAPFVEKTRLDLQYILVHVRNVLVHTFNLLVDIRNPLTDTRDLVMDLRDLPTTARHNHMSIDRKFSLKGRR